VNISPIGTKTPNKDRTLFIKRLPTGETRGLDPRFLGKDTLRLLAHPERPLAAIRALCINCSGCMAEARKCTAVDCPVWPMRFGKNPFHAKAKK
jgi:hypothetical protein